MVFLAGLVIIWIFSSSFVITVIQGSRIKEIIYYLKKVIFNFQYHQTVNFHMFSKNSFYNRYAILIIFAIDVHLKQNDDQIRMLVGDEIYKITIYISKL